MPRPKRKRKIFSMPLAKGFKPFGTPFSDAEIVILLLEEYEAVKLADYMNLTQEEAAKKMNISRPTFTRIYEKARKTIAEAFVEGKIIAIKGGDVDIDTSHLTNEKAKLQMGEGGFCICLKCEVRLEHHKGEPCRDRECPKCGKPMIRENSLHHLALKKENNKE